MKIPVNISKEEVFRQLGCTSDSATYETFEEEYEEIREEILRLCSPLIRMQTGLLPEKGALALYVFATIGKGAEQLAAQEFANGDYVRGMLADAAADSALFSLEEEIRRQVQAYCKERGVGVAKRLEAPNDVPQEIQKVIYDTVDAASLGIGITEGYMFDPVKSLGIVFLLTEDAAQMHTQHDCANCPQTECQKRRVQTVRVTVHQEGCETVALEGVPGENLLDLLRGSGLSHPAPCGGRGACGKCRVQIEKGSAAITAADEKVFDEEQLRSGWRLACRLNVLMNLEIRLPQPEDAFVVQNAAVDIVQDPEDMRSEQQKVESEQKQGDSAAWGIAVDIGTTTIAMQRIDVTTGEILDVWNGVNHQRSFGADVISRMDASVNGKTDRLRELIRSDLAEGIHALLTRSGDTSAIQAAVIAGNTVMLHLLRGYDCSGMTRVPFQPYSLKQEVMPLRELLDAAFLDAPVYLFPGASAFVGGDITAGLYYCDFWKDGRTRMLIDLGTNGEMAIGNKERLLCASTAAGPAFEGGGITWGMGSLPGAIQSVELQGEELCCHTIGGVPARGICGTGVIEAAAALYQLGYMDETGRLDDPFFEKGYPLAVNSEGETIALTQQDIREIQLAKAAIRAGIETLLHRFGVKAQEVEEICLAGGFGFALDCEKAIAIGLFPEEFAGRITAVGNGSLAGCARFLREYPAQKETGAESGFAYEGCVPQRLAERMEETQLASDPVFQKYYMEGMLFDGELV